MKDILFLLVYAKFIFDLLCVCSYFLYYLLYEIEICYYLIFCILIELVWLVIIKSYKYA